MGAYAPERVMTNEEVALMVETSDEWIYTHTGIRRRHIASENQAASDLGVQAAHNLFSRMQQWGESITLEDVDLVLCATSTPDHLSFPSTACIIQNKLGIPNAGAMDLTAACTGFIYAIETAKAFVESGMAKNVLLIGSEIYSRILNWKDRGTCVLFGDGAGAALVSTSNDSPSKIGKGILRSRGSGAAHLTRAAGGSRQAIQFGNLWPEDTCITMNGRQVYIFAVQAIIDSVKAILEANQVTMADIDWVIPHQANRRIIEAACDRESWDINKFCINIEEYANTSAASIPLAAEDLLRNNSLRRGHKVITVGFGAGLTYGGNYFIL